MEDCSRTDEDEINLKYLVITFFIGLFVIFGIYLLFYNDSSPAFKSKLLPPTAFAVKSDTSLTDIGIECEQKLSKDDMLLDDFEEKKEYTPIGESDNSKISFLYNDQFVCEGKKSLEMRIDSSIKEDTTISRTISPLDWQEFKYLIFWATDSGKKINGPDWPSINLLDEDGKPWHHDNGIQQYYVGGQQSWAMLKIPLSSFETPWIGGNNRNGKITGYQFVFNKPESKQPIIILIDKIYLSKT